MNMPIMTGLEDVQNTADKRKLAIDHVGIKSLRYPIFFQVDNDDAINVVADFNMYVSLPHHVKGTHMSRFIELLELPDQTFSINTMKSFMSSMIALLDAEAGCLEMSFPFFIRKSAPVSGVSSMMDYQVTLKADISETFSLNAKIEIPVTSLCPCSKKISQYGAHNQRSLVTIEVKIDREIELNKLISLVEQQASSQLYGLLKRPDEKYVTEFAYDNPKFVEDLVRDIAGVLEKHNAINGFRVECENFESIHNHSAYAVIDRL